MKWTIVLQSKIWKIDCADKKYREQYLTTIKELVTEQIRTQQFIARHPYPVPYLTKQDKVLLFIANSCSEILEKTLNDKWKSERGIIF
jgi:hypothetical protein